MISSLEYSSGMTVREFAVQNRLNENIVRNVLNIKDEGSLERKIGSFGLSRSELLKNINRALALNREYESKNWFKIPLKFALWIAFLAAVFFLFRKNRITGKTRILLYALAVGIFGVIFGSDPSPMGTVKDALVLFGTSGAVFPPRMIALSVFILLTVAANKFICSWGCQFGTLQDLIFRINRNKKDEKGFIKQIKSPSSVSNGIRIAFFIIFTSIVFILSFDLIESVAPFKIFNPKKITIAGGLFLSAILTASLFVYRPWCHLFCPFGLVGWLFEKVSVFKIQVNYETCIACEKCAKACPSDVMGSILKRGSVIPDCFSCWTCINACPTGSIKFMAGKRTRPPTGKFKNS